MFAAIIVALVTLVALVLVVVIVFTVRNRAKTPKAASGKMNVRSIETVGVSSAGTRGRAGGTITQVNTPQTSSSNVSEALRSRFVAMGVLAAGIFGSLGVKVWTMQALSSDQYTKEAEENLYTTVLTPAPRGVIYDAAGIPLVQNRISLTVLADAEVINDHDVMQRLSTVLGIPFNIIRQRIQDASSGAQSQRVVASDVKLRDIAFISEHITAFPGVTTQERSVRSYPWGALGAHVLGYTGPANEEELKLFELIEGTKVEMGDTTGKGGVEQTYENLLAGDHGEMTVKVDADGAVRQIQSETDPTKGNDIYLTIKAPVQHVADKMLAELIAPEGGTIGTGIGTAGAIIAMDVTDGGVIALANYPTYSPESFIGGISQDTWDLFNTVDSHYPLLNRAIAGEYPAASTYKAFTGLAGLTYGMADATRTWDCSGSWDGWNTGAPQKCWLHSGHGGMTFRDGIVQSCDTVFYSIAYDFFQAGQAGSISSTAMQDFIRRYGFGSTTGIDLASETAGRVPDAAWKSAYYKNTPEDAQWVGGDMTNMVIGQGYVTTTPLQIAAAYAGIATGKIMRPHLLKEVRNSSGQVVVTAPSEVVRTPEVIPEHLATVRDALHGVATESASGIAHLFAQYGIDAAAKTGTAEFGDKDDYAWFVCYAPYDNPKYVMACVVEEGGGGGSVAAPLGAAIMNAIFSCDAGTLDATSMGVIAGSSGKTIKREHYASSTGRRD